MPRGSPIDSRALVVGRDVRCHVHGAQSPGQLRSIITKAASLGVDDETVAVPNQRVPHEVVLGLFAFALLVETRFRIGRIRTLLAVEAIRRSSARTAFLDAHLAAKFMSQLLAHKEVPGLLSLEFTVLGVK